MIFAYLADFIFSLKNFGRNFISINATSARSTKTYMNTLVRGRIYEKTFNSTLSLLFLTNAYVFLKSTTTNIVRHIFHICSKYLTNCFFHALPKRTASLKLSFFEHSSRSNYACSWLSLTNVGETKAGHRQYLRSKVHRDEHRST